MATEFPSNSNPPKGQPKVVTPPKKVSKVVTGSVTTRKKPLGKRFTETFTGGDTRGVADYVVFEVALPALKDLIADVVSQGVERKLFGEARSVSRRGGVRTNPPYTAYNRIGGSAPVQDPRQTISRRSRATHNFSEILIETRVEAENVIDGLYSILDQYGSVTVADLYEMCGVPGQFTDEKYGWTNLSGSMATRTRQGYLLDLPKPELLD